jgi:putative transposase
MAIICSKTIMSDKFQDRYRIPSSRWQEWDYGWNGAYFITICTAGRECYFGKIVNGKMILSEIGKIADHFWYEIPNHFPFAELGEFIVMPNHVHGIVVLDKVNNDPYSNVDLYADVETPDPGVCIILDNVAKTPGSGVSTTIPPICTSAAFKKWKHGILGVILNQYKRICTIHSRKIRPGFDWQSRFHDHVIRDDDSFQRITAYIQNNPENWITDDFYNATLRMPDIAP